MTESKAPTHRAVIGRDYKDAAGTDKTHWTEIGAAWPIKEGKGLRVVLDAIPVDGKLMLLPNEPKTQGNSDV
jgi:hypothetical protein